MEIVWVGARDAATPATRSAFAARLTPFCACGAVENALSPLVRSWPEANCTAPNVAETAITLKIPVRRSDMTLVPRPMWRSGDLTLVARGRFWDGPIT